MEMVHIPLVALQAGLEHWRESQAKYRELGDTFADLEAWCSIRADVYEHIIDTYANEKENN